jgi:hypothetical protein
VSFLFLISEEVQGQSFEVLTQGVQCLCGLHFEFLIGGMRLSGFLLFWCLMGFLLALMLSDFS